MRTPLVVATGIDPIAMDAALLSLSWDMPGAVVVRHRIDPHSEVLTRTVSDAHGVIEHEQIPLEHACVSCALREDIAPTLERLARLGRWSTIVAGLPVGTEAAQLVHLLARETRLARHLKLGAVVATLGAERIVDDLLGDALLRESDRHVNPGDDRGTGEVACAQVEFADVVVLDADPGAEALDLVRALARPDAVVLAGTDLLDGMTLAAHRHQNTRTSSWCALELGAEVPPLGGTQAWRLELSSSRPFHPERLLEQIDRLGTGPHRSRGCFWLPTRAGAILEWSGAGGQLSIGSHTRWGRGTPRTRLLLTGLGDAPHDLVVAFDELLLTPAESRLGRQAWDMTEDGLEPWLGDIRDVA